MDAGPSTTTPGCSAQVDVDLTEPLGRSAESQVVAEIIARVVAACRHEGLIDDESVLRIVRLTAEGEVGVQLAAAVNQSAYSICSGLASLSPSLPAATSRTLTVLLSGARVHVVGAGCAGLGLVTLGPVIPSLVPSYGDGLSITQRRVSRLALSAPGSSSGAAVVRVLDEVSRSLEESPGR